MTHVISDRNEDRKEHRVAEAETEMGKEKRNNKWKNDSKKVTNKKKIKHSENT